MPKDVCMNLPKLVLNGDVECFCSGCTAINKYTSEEIKLSAGGRVICIKGSRLLIKSIDEEEVTIAGKISAVELI